MNKPFAGLLVALTVLTFAGNAGAQTTYTWNDSGSDWGTATNWNPNTVPNDLTNHIASFANRSAINNQPTIGTGSFSVRGMTIDNTGADWNLSGTTGAVTTGVNGITFTGGGASTISANLRVIGDQIWATGSTNVTMGGALDGISKIEKSGSGILILDNAANLYSGRITVSGSGGILQIGSTTNASASQALRSTSVELGSGTSLTTVGTVLDLRVGSLSGSGSVTPATGGINILARESAVFSGTITTTGGLNLRGANGTTQGFTGNLTALTGTIGINSGATIQLSGTGDSTSGVLGGTITTRGGTFLLDNSSGNTSAANGRIGDTAMITLGGGGLSLVGNSSGTTETVGLFTMNSGSSTITVTNNGGAGTVLAFTDSGSLRDSTSATLNFVGSGTGTLGSAGNAPRITFSGALNANTVNNALTSSASGATTVTYGWARVNGTSWAGNGSNGIFALAETTRTSATLGSAAANELTTFTPTTTVTTLTADLGAAATSLLLKIVPSSAGQSLASGGFSINASAIMLAGSTDFSITGAGSFFGTVASTRYVYVTDSNTVLSVTQSFAGANQPFVKSGAGTVSLNGTGNQLGFTTAQNVNVVEGTLRSTLTSLGGGTAAGGAFSNLNLYGGVLEISGGGSFTRALGTNAIVGTASGGTLKWDNNNANARGDGGFSAIGGDATVTLVITVGGLTASTPNWNDVGFLQNGYALLLGSNRANSAITFTNGFGLDSIATTNNYFAREVRVADNVNSANDRAILTGVISGSVSADLLKTGNGLLLLSATTGNTYQGNTLVQGGTLRAGSLSNAFGNGTGNVIVGTGATVDTIANPSPILISNSVFVLSGGTLRADNGTGTGILTITKNATFGNNSTLLSAVNAASTNNASLVSISGVLDRDTTSSVIKIQLADGGTLTAGTEYTRRIAEFGSLGSNLSAGTYTASTMNTPFDVNANNWSVQVVLNNASAGDTSGFINVTFTPVPEPGTLFAFGAAGMALVGGIRRFRRRGMSAEATSVV